jgi:hypothetical protein
MMEAVVHAGTMETRYRRAGQGPQLLLLGGGADAEWVAGVIPPLVARFRVFVPEVPSDAGTGWLREMIDGLGLDRPGLVAGFTLAPLLDRFLETDADRLERVALIHPAPTGPFHGRPVVPIFPPPIDAESVGALLAFLDPDA